MWHAILSRLRIGLGIAGVSWVCCAAWSADAAGQDFESEPISYAKQSADNPVSRLFRQLEQGDNRLAYHPQFGYLPALLKALDVPVSSQTLVYSKTSLQRHRIAPRTPRAIYFNDDVYIGYCQDGDVLEISVADDRLGTVFYSLDQAETADLHLVRQTDNCLICHGSSATRQVPGHLVRSVYVDASGLPMLASSTYRTDYTSPFNQRWGGWYVTGTHGNQKHLGNYVHQGHGQPERADNSAGQNVASLADRFDTSKYLTPHSDLVALMVLEHQVAFHNALVFANFQTRQATHYEKTLNEGLGEPAGTAWESTGRRIAAGCEPLVECLFFCEEAELTAPIRGTSAYADEFARRGPHDAAGRSLHEFDLSRRIFRYPSSYLIYTSGFRNLPPEAMQYVRRRMHEVLDGTDASRKFAHLSADDRRAIREILTATLPEFRLPTQVSAD